MTLWQSVAQTKTDPGNKGTHMYAVNTPIAQHAAQCKHTALMHDCTDSTLSIYFYFLKSKAPRSPIFFI